MSSYLSSYILDPFARQVRRLSHSDDVSQAQAPSAHQSHDASTAVTFTPDAASATTDPESLAGQPTTIVSSPSSSPALSPHPTISRSTVLPITDRPRANTSLGGRGSRSAAAASGSRRRSLPGREERSSDAAASLVEAWASAGRPFLSSVGNGDVTTAVEARRRRMDSASSVSSHTSRRRDASGPLPADDGQGILRRRIVAIQAMDASSREKARLMHLLMTETYQQSEQSTLTFAPTGGPQSVSGFAGHDRSRTPSSINSYHGSAYEQRSSTPTSTSSVPVDNPYQLTAEDLEATYVPVQNTSATTDGRTDGSSRHSSEEPRTSKEKGKDDGSLAFGCAHYKRNVKLQCSACHRWYTCRFCHDEVEDHVLVRRETKNMLCMLCGCAQPAAETCVDCDQRAAWYYCSICKLWDDDMEKSIYHCNDCGICRVGQGLGKDYFHCNTCCVCMSISIADSHKCIERSTDCDCPICGEYMFTSPLTVVFMQCGHSIHHKCYYEHMKMSYRCPICSRSIINMETQFRNLDRSIESQPMPAQFQDTKALVYCNDCCAKSSVSYHWLGLKCGVCDSYNTAQLQIISGPDPTTLSNDPSSLGQPVLQPGAADPLTEDDVSNSDAVRQARYSPLSDSAGRPSGMPQAPDRSTSGVATGGSLEASSESSGDEGMEEVDFWGRDGHIHASSTQHSEVADGDVEPADEDNVSIEEDDEVDEDDELELLGHR